MQTSSQPIQELETCFDGQTCVYQECLAMAENALSVSESGQMQFESLDQMKCHLFGIVELEQAAAQLTATLSPTELKDPALVAARAELRTAIEKLINKTAELESSINSVREGMLPQLSQHLAASKMSKAYSQRV